MLPATEMHTMMRIRPGMARMKPAMAMPRGFPNKPMELKMRPSNHTMMPPMTDHDRRMLSNEKMNPAVPRPLDLLAGADAVWMIMV